MKQKMKSIFLIPILLLAISKIGNGAKKDYFTAGVFEKALLHSVEGKTPRETLEINLNLYEKAASEAAERNVDILVFGEYALYPYQERTELAKFAENVPDPRKTKANPCLQIDSFYDKPTLTKLSCIARKYGLYIAANLVDKQPCVERNECDKDHMDECSSSCPSDGVLMYNTNIAFDRDGNLIARYYKNHPYYEDVNIPVHPEMKTFDTEFGRFGFIICFDSVFKHSINLVENHNVDTLLFLTHWFDEILPINAIEWQQSWALANNVNVLAANVYNPGMSTIGSGIYSKKFGVLNYSYNPDGKSKLVVARVPLNDEKQSFIRSGSSNVVVVTENNVYEKEEFGDNFLEQCYTGILGPPKNTLTDYRCMKQLLQNYSLTQLETGNHEVESCNDGFCCKAKYSGNIKNGENYYLAAFNGLNLVQGLFECHKDFFKWHEETCLVVRCDPFEGKPCVLLPSRAESTFDFVELSATFSAERVYPAVSQSQNRLAPKHKWIVKRKDKKVTLVYHEKSSNPLLKVALVGRCYAKDPEWVPYYKFSA